MCAKQQERTAPGVRCEDIPLRKQARMGIIYKLTAPSKKVYIGQCQRKNRHTREELSPQAQMHLRWREHCQATSGCCAIKNAVAKYGKDSFQVDVLLVVPDSELSTYERHFIEMYASNDHRYGYNRTVGGEGGGFGIPEVRKAQCQPGSKWMNAVSDPEVVKRKIVAMHNDESRAKVAATKIAKRAAQLEQLPEADRAKAEVKKIRLAEAQARLRARRRGDDSAANAKRKKWKGV